MAAKDPNIIDKSERKIIICCQDVMALSKAENVTRTKIVIAAILGTIAKKAVTGVGAPS